MRLFRPTDQRAGSLELDAEHEDEQAEAPKSTRFPGRMVGVPALVYRSASGAAVKREAKAALARAAAGSGQPLPTALRQRIERALAIDLSAVRIHTGRASQEAAAAVGANAYTVGQDIHFAAGKYQPETPSGFKLVVHEVAHTAQQIGAAGSGELTVSSPGDAVEREAERIAERISAEPEAAEVAAIAGAIRPRVGHVDASGERVADAWAAAREAETPGALPMKISSQVSGQLMRDGDDGAGGAGGGTGGDAGADGDPVGPTSGTVGDETFDPGTGAGGCDLHGPGCGGGHELRIATRFDTTPVVTRGAFAGGSVGYDTIGGSLTSDSSVGRGGGIPGSAFGKATPKFQTKDMNWTVNGSTVNVTGQVFVNVRWDVQSRGRVSIESAEDGYLGPGNFMQAHDDLSAPYPRDMFWVQSLTEQHEQVHVQEYIANTAKEAASAASWLASQPIKVPKSSSDKGIQEQLDPLIKQIANTVGNAVLATFGAGGEERAYSAGAGAYQAIADAILAKGTKLKWDKQSGSDKNNKGGRVAPEYRPQHRPEEDGQDGWAQGERAAGPVRREASGGEIAPDAQKKLERAAKQSGVPLPDALRERVERALAVDLSDVRVHTGGASQEAARAVGANAYTVGQDIHFGAGKFQPDSQTGYKLLVHEVAHTAQQGAGAQTSSLQVSKPSDAVEQEAHAVAEAITPQAGYRDRSAARLGASQGAARQAAMPGALPLTLAHRVSGQVMRDPDPAAPAAPAADGDDPDAQPAEPRQGTFPDVEVKGNAGVGGCDLHGPGCGGGHQLRVSTNLNVTPTIRQGGDGRHATAFDSISAGGISSGTSISQGGVTIPGGAFGYTEPTFKTGNMAYSVGKNTVEVTGGVNIDVHWDTTPLGRTPVESADDPAIGPRNFMKVYYDLRQEGEKPVREKYWVPSLTSTHEQFHANEYVTNGTEEVAHVISWLNAQPISIPSGLGKFFGTSKSVADQLDPLIAQISKKLFDAVLARFAGGEGRAYGAGSAAYNTLANSIRDKGFAAGWDKANGKPIPNAGMDDDAIGPPAPNGPANGAGS